jgi:pimeloyl-ACP methyl ester carboxylesterase
MSMAENTTIFPMFAVDSGAGEPAVFIHGVGSDHESWNGVIGALGQRYRCLRYDLRGHGSSPKMPGPYKLIDFVVDLENILHLRSWPKRFHLVGFSLGGLVAQAYTLAHQDRVATLTIISSVAGRSTAEQAKVDERAAQLAKGGASVHLETAVGRWFSDSFRESHPEIVEKRMARSLENDPACYAAAYQVLAATDLIHELDRIRCPSLVATGAEDQGSTPRMARAMAEKMHNSELHILEGLRHSVLLEAPGQVGVLVGTFFAAHPIN